MKIKTSNNLSDLIYALERACYYFDMKPFEFWNSTVREVYTYFNSRAIRRLDDFRDEINLQEAVTNKILAGDCMNEKAKILMIRDSFSELFENEEEEQTLEEQRKLFKG